MSLHQYKASKEIEQLKHERGWPYYSLIMAAMRLADSKNLRMLQQCWPDIWEDLQARYHAPGGLLEGEEDAYEGIVYRD